jgi:ribosome-associated translation inhibitor RaiA
MNIQLIGDNFDITPTVKSMADAKIGQKLDILLTKFSPDVTNALIRIQKTKLDQYMVNFDMNLPGKKHIYAQTQHLILESAFIDLEQEVKRQILKFKET